MARIKFTKEGLGGFGLKAPFRTKRPDETDPRVAIGAIRQGVAAAKEAGQLVSGLADLTAKTAGRQPTTKDLMEEAAKKRAKDIQARRGGEREKLETAAEMRAKRVAELQEGPSRPAVAAPVVQVEEAERRVAAEAKKAGVPQAGMPAPQVTPQTFTDFAAKLDETKARDVYSRLVSKPETERTRQEEMLLQAVVAKFPTIRKEFEGQVGETREVTAFTEGTKKFIQEAEQRKAQLQQAGQTAAIRQQIKKLDQQIAAAKQAAPQQAPTKISDVAKQMMFNTKSSDQKAADLEKERNQLTQQLAEVEQLAASQQSNETQRIAALQASSTGVLAAVAELQGLNQKRATEGLTEEEAERFVQLEGYIRQARNLAEQVKDLATDDKNFAKTVQDFQKAINEGRLPPPETAEQREARFTESLKLFDDATAAEIKTATEEEATKIGAEYIDADQLKLMAAAAARFNDQKLAGKVLAYLYKDKVAGIQPQNFTDWVSGNYKKTFADEVMRVLFTKTSGKTPAELALALNKFRMKALSDITLMESREATKTETERKTREGKETFETRKKTGEAKLTSAEQAAKKAKALTAKEIKTGLEQLKAKRIKAEDDAKYYQRTANLRRRLLQAQASYYFGRNAAEAKKFERGENKTAIINTAKNIRQSANYLGSLRTSNQKSQEAFSKYAKYFNADGSENTAAVKRDFPAKKSPNYKSRVNALGGGSYGKETLQKLRLGYEDYKAKRGVSVDDTATFRKRQNAYDTIVKGLSQLTVISQSGKIKATDKEASEKLQKITTAQQKLLTLSNELGQDTTTFKANTTDFQTKVKDIIKEAKDGIK